MSSISQTCKHDDDDEIDDEQRDNRGFQDEHDPVEGVLLEDCVDAVQRMELPSVGPYPSKKSASAYLNVLELR